MFYKISISYETPKECYAAIAALLEMEEVPEHFYQFRDTYGTQELVDKLVALGAKPQLERVKGVSYAPASPAAQAVNNSTTVISVANHNLFEVTKVTWIENACTEELQRMLDAGWRILAVCPSNDARRPDYVLGLKE
jgi:hypothetical protein